MTGHHKQALPPGFRLGSYRVVRVLGVGGFGVTYLCEHGGLGVQVAVKEYLPNEIAVRDGAAVQAKSAGDREGFEWGLSRFLDEARTLARFEHRNVVRVRDCFEANSTAYIVMDYEDGESLDRLLQRLGTLTEAQLKRVVLPVAEGLREVHAAGFLHRDVKPSNIFVRRSDESPVLLDFGSARQALGRKSRSMTAIASAGYSPPEQYESQGGQGAWTDIYALCALCHRAITGEVPVEAPRRTGEVSRRRADPQARLAAGVAGYSSSLLEAVDWGLRLIETERPQSLADWVARMEKSVPPELADAGGAGDADTQRIRLLREAAEQGNARAQYSLAVLYRAGNGVAKDTRKAALWFRKAAEQGDPRAKLQVAFLEGAPQAARQDADSTQRAQRLKASADGAGGTAKFLVGGLIVGMIAAIWWSGVSKREERGRDWPNEIRPREDTPRPNATVPTSLPKSNPVVSPPSLQELAEQGGADAQFRLGVSYYNGDGVLKDAGEAARWYRKAAEQGHATAQVNLGFLYANGDGVPKDAREAARWYRKAAEQGDAMAQVNLGFLYANGDGVRKDAREAARWYRRSAEQGDANAQFGLGSLYYLGEGLPKDDREAAQWFRKAAEQGNAGAQFVLATLYYAGDGVPKDAREAAQWYRKAAEQGNASAQFKLGVMYRIGDGVAKDDREAIRWYQKAAEQGIAPAQFNLGLMYDKGEGVAKDAREAVRWYRKAAEQGDASAQLKLGVMYSIGDGVAKDDREAVRWWGKAAEQGDASAQFNLGLMYDRGEGVAKDAREAAQWYGKAAAQGHANAQFSLGVMYQRGEGVDKDAREAAQWYRKAAEQGHAKAQFNLGSLLLWGEGVAKDILLAYGWVTLAAAQGDERAVEARTILQGNMTPAQIAEGEKRSRELVR